MHVERSGIRPPYNDEKFGNVSRRTVVTILLVLGPPKATSLLREIVSDHAYSGPPPAQLRLHAPYHDLEPQEMAD